MTDNEFTSEEIELIVEMVNEGVNLTDAMGLIYSNRKAATLKHED